MRMNPMIPALLGAMAILALAGCKHEGSAVQKQYAADRNECREYAEETVARMSGRYMETGNEHLALVEQFARCMHTRGWAVNRPPKRGEEG